VSPYAEPYFLPIRRRNHATPGYPDPVPVLVLLLALILAVLVWRYAAARRAAGPQLRPRFVGPDDDPDFLRELSRRTQRDEDLP
jgi:hypothetical protein